MMTIMMMVIKNSDDDDHISNFDAGDDYKATMYYVQIEIQNIDKGY